MTSRVANRVETQPATACVRCGIGKRAAAEQPESGPPINPRFFITYCRGGVRWKVELPAADPVEALKTAVGFCESALRRKEPFGFVSVTLE